MAAAPARPPPAAPQLLLPAAALAAHERGEPDVDDSRVLLLEPGGALLQCALGDHRPGASLQPRPVPAFALLRALYSKTVAAVAVGGGHVLALCVGASATEVLSWGRGDEGQLGHGARESEAHPRTVSKFQGKGASAVACGARHSIVIAGGAAYACGAGDAGQLGLGDAKTQAYRGVCAGHVRGAAAAGGWRWPHTLLVDARGAVHACGGGSSGQSLPGPLPTSISRCSASLGGQLAATRRRAMRTRCC